MSNKLEGGLNRKALIGIPVKYGSLALLLNAIVLAVLYYTGKHPLLIPPFLDVRILLFLIFIYFAIREYKENITGGFLHFWEGMLLGTFLTFFLAVTGAFLIKIWIEIEPEFLSEYISQSTAAMAVARDSLVNGPQKVTISPEEFDYQMEMLQKTTAAQLALDYFIKTLVIGFFLPIIYSIIFRRVER